MRRGGTTAPGARASGGRVDAALRRVRYDVPGWGAGDLLFAGDDPVAHDFPRPPAGGAGPASDAQRGLVDRLRAYFAGARESFADLDLTPAVERWGLTPFELAVTRVLHAVPYGTTVSYGELADAAGYARAARAAGSVCARGMLSLIVPYHRVIAADGRLGPYGPGGAGLKRRLLALEGVSPA